MERKVLLVDDQPFVLSLGREILEQNDFSVITAENGLEGVAQARAHQPDLIILDVEMPKMNGLEACRWLRQVEALKNVPIIMLTSKTNAVDMEKGLQAGADLYISKPFDEKKLMAVVKTALTKVGV